MTKAHCNECGGERNHEVLREVTKRWESEDGDISGGDKFEMLQCCGCESIVLRHTSWNSEEYERSKPIYYPPAVARREPEWLSKWTFAANASAAVRELLREIYIALHNNSRRLAGMGIRALLEHIMIEKVNDQGSFYNSMATGGDGGKG